MDIRVCGEIQFSTVFFNRGSWNPSIPQKHVVGLREFQGFREGSSFFRGNDFLLPFVDASL